MELISESQWKEMDCLEIYSKLTNASGEPSGGDGGNNQQAAQTEAVPAGADSGKELPAEAQQRDNKHQGSAIANKNAVVVAAAAKKAPAGTASASQAQRQKQAQAILDFQTAYVQKKTGKNYNNELVKQSVLQLLVQWNGDDKLLNSILRNITNETNQLVSLTQLEITTLKKLLDLKGLLAGGGADNSDQWSLDVKNSIEKLAELVNIAEKDADTLISAILMTNYDRLFESFTALGLIAQAEEGSSNGGGASSSSAGTTSAQGTALPSGSDSQVAGRGIVSDPQGYVRYALGKIQGVQMRYQIIYSGKIAQLLKTNLPNELLHCVLFGKKKRLSLAAQLQLLQIVQGVQFVTDDTATKQSVRKLWGAVSPYLKVMNSLVDDATLLNDILL